MIEICIIENRKIAIKGIGKLFYESGFPISMTVSELKKRGIEVSILHVADECFKNGWSKETILNKFKVDFEDDIDKNNFDFKRLELFCSSTYEEQRELIFNYLFKDIIESKEWFKQIIIQ